MGILSRIHARLAQFNELQRKVEILQLAAGRIESRQCASLHNPSSPFSDVEFRIFSQWGEDGIIQHLIRHVPVARPLFVEFGVEDYREANTRFLLQQNNWEGLVLDSSEANIRAIRRDPISYRHALHAVRAFVDRDNINQILTDNGCTGDIGLLSIDIDGNDYWVWDAITVISPRIVICEYENLFGCERAVVTPYAPDFDRQKAHFSMLYGGASLRALDLLAQKKGYTLAGSNSAGNNAFFIRNDLFGPFHAVSPGEAYTPARYRSSRDPEGTLTFLDIREGRRLVAHLPLLDIETGNTIRVGDLSSPGDNL